VEATVDICYYNSSILIPQMMAFFFVSRQVDLGVSRVSSVR
jgi:hypothetical protein